jgi:branched-chain amino acid transport system ATP-binding protein
MDALLEVTGVTMRFGGSVALHDVAITAAAGTITGLMGPNGAGKTTMFNCVTGLLPPSSGEIRFDGHDITTLPPFKRARRGISRTFQRLELFTSLTVRDNIAVAGQIRNRWHRSSVDVDDKARDVMHKLGLLSIADREVTEIPTGMARRVEVARALMTDPKMLLLDEPASGQDDHETDAFGDLLLTLADDGMGILLVEHDVPFVFRLCSLVHVLDFGRIIACGPPDVIRDDQTVIDAYLGAVESTV